MMTVIETCVASEAKHDLARAPSPNRYTININC